MNELAQQEVQLKAMALDIASRTPGIKNSEVIVLAKEILAFLKEGM